MQGGVRLECYIVLYSARLGEVRVLYSARLGEVIVLFSVIWCKVG